MFVHVNIVNITVSKQNVQLPGFHLNVPQILREQKKMQMCVSSTTAVTAHIRCLMHALS